MARPTAKASANKASSTRSAVGRPTKRTPSAQEYILAAIRLGATYELAAKAGGITYETFNEWRKEFSEFSEAITAAEAEAAQGALSMIAAAMPQHWQAAAWWLERRYPRDYGKQSMEHSGIIEVYVRYTNDWRGTGTAQQANRTEAPRNVIHIPIPDHPDQEGAAE